MHTSYSEGLGAPPCRAAMLAFILVVFVAGCGGNSDGWAQVSGDVTFEGQPIEDGRVSFEPTGKGSSFDGAIVKGRYQFKEVKPGTFKVRIEAYQHTGKAFEKDGEKIKERQKFLPEIYHKNTTLTAELTSSPKQTIDFNLKKSPGK